MQNNRMRALIMISSLIIGNSCLAQEEQSQPNVSEQAMTAPAQTAITEQPIQETPAVAVPPVESLPPSEPAVVEPTPDVATEPTEPVTTPEQDEIEIKGIDTVDIAQPKGNWLYKRIWWEKAERLYEKIKQLANEISESRIVFF